MIATGRSKLAGPITGRVERGGDTGGVLRDEQYAGRTRRQRRARSGSRNAGLQQVGPAADGKHDHCDRAAHGGGRACQSG